MDIWVLIPIKKLSVDPTILFQETCIWEIGCFSPKGRVTEPRNRAGLRLVSPSIACVYIYIERERAIENHWACSRARRACVACAFVGSLCSYNPMLGKGHILVDLDGYCYMPIMATSCLCDIVACVTFYRQNLCFSHILCPRRSTTERQNTACHNTMMGKGVGDWGVQGK